MFSIEKLIYTDSGNFFLLAGPCVIEGRDMAFDIAGTLKEVSDKLKIPFIFKGSFKKANRSRIDSFTGIGDLKALEILKSVGEYFDIPVVTDIHTTEDAVMAKDFVDVLQIPAFLCRQTDLLVAAAKTGKVVNIKKGQFLAGEAMQFAAQKVVDEVENRAIDRHLKKASEIEDCLVEVLSDLYTETEEKEFEFNENGPTVIMMVGVNGAGKTTTTAKLSNYFLKQGKTV